jgi:hypothetical protein
MLTLTTVLAVLAIATAVLTLIKAFYEMKTARYNYKAVQ